MMPSPETAVEATATATATAATATATSHVGLKLVPLPHFQPELYDRAWTSAPHPTLPLIATAHQKSTTVFSLSTLSSHSTLSGGHMRSVRSVTWKPNLSPQKLCLVTGSFDSTAGLWRWEDENASGGKLEVEITSSSDAGAARGDDGDEKDWEFALVLEGHDSEVKSVAFSPTGQYLATCSRDKSVWIWEDVGANETDDEWETVAVLNEHEGDVKAIAWCPETNRSGHGRYSNDVLASASYDDTVRIWREDDDGEWVCVAVLEGHGGTVWGVQWEPKPKGTGFPRLLTWSADRTIRVWTLKEEGDDDSGEAPRHAWGGIGGIPNTMRRSRKEEWKCTATLPKVHTRDVYSSSWSADSTMVASTGSDGVIAIYKEEEQESAARGATEHAAQNEAAAELDGDDHMTNGNTEALGTTGGTTTWRVVGIMENGHGPYEINHVTWCKRYDSQCTADKRGVEEMLVTTGDDGAVRPWQLV